MQSPADRDDMRPRRGPAVTTVANFRRPYDEGSIRKPLISFALATAPTSAISDDRVTCVVNIDDSRWLPETDSYACACPRRFSRLRTF
jgi:hypothetical protein